MTRIELVVFFHTELLMINYKILNFRAISKPKISNSKFAHLELFIFCNIEHWKYSKIWIFVLFLQTNIFGVLKKFGQPKWAAISSSHKSWHYSSKNRCRDRFASHSATAVAARSKLKMLTRHDSLWLPWTQTFTSSQNCFCFVLSIPWEMDKNGEFMRQKWIETKHESLVKCLIFLEWSLHICTLRQSQRFYWKIRKNCSDILV